MELTKLDDRRHALAIARSMEQQGLFFGGGINMVLFDSNNDQYFFTEATLAFIPGRSEFPSAPVGVFPYTTPCYSYNCQPGGTPCYSYLCPNRQNIVRTPLIAEIGQHVTSCSCMHARHIADSTLIICCHHIVSFPETVPGTGQTQQRNVRL